MQKHILFLSLMSVTKTETKKIPMKKIFLSLSISGAFTYASAQSTTLDFETWSGAGANTAPSGWVSENAAVLPPLYNNPQSLFQATSPDIHGGANAMKIISVKMVKNPAPGKLPDPIGLAATGIVNLSPPGLVFGYEYAARPNTVAFWYKYAPSGVDSAGFFVALTKWNTATSKRDTIAIATWNTNATVSTFSQMTLTLTYLLPSIPDSAALIFSSTALINANYSLCMTCGKAGSTLWVDDITFNGWNGVYEYPGSEGVILYPNPVRMDSYGANNIINVSVDGNDAVSAIVYDATGRVVASSSLFEPSGLNRKGGTINTSSLSSGMYSYSIIDKSSRALRSGKFSVLK